MHHKAVDKQNFAFAKSSMLKTVGGQGRPESADLPFKVMNTHSPATTDANRRYIVYSPVTELALDLKDLSGFEDTPKRRLSLSSVTTPTPTALLKQSPKAKRLSCASDASSDAGRDLDTSSPLLEVNNGNSRKNIGSSALKRFKSLPVFGLDEQHNSQPSLTRLKCRSRLSADSNFILPPRFTLFAPEESGPQSSQDSGCGKDEFQFAQPTIPPSRWSRETSADMVPAEKSSDVAGVLVRQHLTAPAAENKGFTYFGELVDGCPLLQSSLCSTDCDDDSAVSSGKGGHHKEKDDGFLELSGLNDNGDEEESFRMPHGIAGLLTAPMVVNSGSHVETPSRKRSLFRSPSVPNLQQRSRVNKNAVPLAQCTLRACIKRVEPPSRRDDGVPTPVANKRRRPTADEDAGNSSDDSEVAVDEDTLLSGCELTMGSAADVVLRPRQASTCHLQRCKSMVEQSVQFYMNRTDDSVDVTGDLITPCCLPLVKSKHGDLRCITPDTLAKLLQNQYRHMVDKFYIIDCRYPYEYEGGHVKGAVNLYSKDGLYDEFLRRPPGQRLPPRDGHGTANDPAEVGRTILIFHCEFSSERGPKLSRFLRNHDRQSNKEQYPWLFYPELYLLEGGYKAFYEQFAWLCEPQAYKPMLHPDHSVDLRQFRQKSKSWCGGGGGSDSSGSSGGESKGRARVPLRPRFTLAW